MKKIISTCCLGIMLIACNSNIDKPDNSDNNTVTDSLGRKEEIEIPQTVDERIDDIRKWYAEIDRMPKSNCRTKTRTAYDGLTPENTFPFEQKASRCQLNDSYELVEGDLLGYEWGYTVHIYKKDGKIFFVFIEGGAEAWTYERRYYCDKDEQVIRFLEREGEGGDEPNGPQKTMKLKNSSSNIRDYVGDDFKEIEKILKEKI